MKCPEWLKKCWLPLAAIAAYLIFRRKPEASYEDLQEAQDEAKEAKHDLIDAESDLAKEKIKHEHEKEAAAIELEEENAHAALDDYTVDDMHAEAIALSRKNAGSGTSD